MREERENRHRRRAKMREEFKCWLEEPTPNGFRDYHHFNKYRKKMRESRFAHHHDWRKHDHQFTPPKMFLRFAGTFGFLTLLLILCIFLIIFIFRGISSGLTGLESGVWPLWIGVLMIFAGLLFIFSRGAYSNITAQLSDVVKAANKVAEGDLSVRVDLKKRGEFNDLADSFNHMIGELERMDKQRRNLTADVAHELRTPLQIIQGNLEGIIDGVYQADEEHIQSTLDETRLLARLISDLRELSLAESGELKLNLEILNLNDFLRDVYTSYKAKADIGQIQLELVNHCAQRELVADPDRLLQVLGNLVNNALRYTSPGGKVEMRCDAWKDGVCIQVVDTGKGISKEDLPFVFDRFWRADTARQHSDGAGSGLGLAISQKLIEAHGGFIEVYSEIDKGTLFRVCLPSHPADVIGSGSIPA